MILKQNAQQVYDNSEDAGEKDHMRLNHDPLPSTHLQQKVDYFFRNHNIKQNLNTSMIEMKNAINAIHGVQDKGWYQLNKFVTSKNIDEEKRNRIYMQLWKRGGADA